MTTGSSYFFDSQLRNFDVLTEPSTTRGPRISSRYSALELPTGRNSVKYSSNSFSLINSETNYIQSQELVTAGEDFSVENQ
jgi:hypothetical protein